MFIKLIKKIKYFFIGLKFRYLVKLIAMNYCDNIYYQIQGRISALDKNTLLRPNFIPELFDEFKFPNISIDKKSMSYSITNHSYSKNDLPQKYNCHLEDNGTIDIYSFQYEIKEGYLLLTKLNPDLKLINEDYDFIFIPNIAANTIGFNYPNWCSKSQQDIIQKANIIFDNLDALIQSIVNEINYFNNFKFKVNAYIKKRIIDLN